MPTAGARVTISFLGRQVGGLIDEVQDDGRRLLVATDDGERMTFALSRANGQFVHEGDQTGARLSFDD
jgi:hypothetical protein